MCLLTFDTIFFLEKTVYTQEGVLRGCAKLDTSFESKSENCTTSKMVKDV